MPATSAVSSCSVVEELGVDSTLTLIFIPSSKALASRSPAPASGSTSALPPSPSPPPSPLPSSSATAANVSRTSRREHITSAVTPGSAATSKGCRPPEASSSLRRRPGPSLRE